MAQWYRCQVTIPHDSGLPEDAVVNTWHYMIPGSGDREVLATDFEARLDGFYTAWVPTAAANPYDWNAMATKHYDFLDDQPRIPFYTGVITAGTTSAAGYDMPAEVSICLSMKAAIASGDNARRKRGRVFLGPFINYGPADQAMTPSALADLISDAADTAFGSTGGSNTRLAVYSPYTHHGVPVGERLDPDVYPENPEFLPAAFSEVVTIWVDNAYDTQRRRGPKATYRKTNTIA